MSAVRKNRDRSSVLGMVLNEDRFAKAVASDADLINLDLEDAVVPADKAKAREKVVELVKRGRDAVGERELWVRINHLSSPWGLDDLQAIVKLDIDGIIYPQIKEGGEVRVLRSILDGHGSKASLHLILETPESFLNIKDIMAAPGISGITHGPGDLRQLTGIAMSNRASLDVTAMLTVMAARAYGCRAADGMHLEDFRNLDTVRDYVKISKSQGFDTVNSFYLPHMAIINEVMSPTEAEIAEARTIVLAFEKARADGQPATVVNGKPILVHQYRNAVALLAAA